MCPPIEQYPNFLCMKGHAPVTLKVLRQDLTHFVAWRERMRQQTFDLGLLRHEDLRDW
jgi:hypothetical protein